MGQVLLNDNTALTLQSILLFTCPTMYYEDQYDFSEVYLRLEAYSALKDFLSSRFTQAWVISPQCLNLVETCA